MIRKLFVENVRLFEETQAEQIFWSQVKLFGRKFKIALFYNYEGMQ